MMNWPDNKRIAVMMAFDLDAETMWTTHGDGSTAHMTNLSRGAYGPKQGVPRILDMLDSHQVKATFFIPGVVAEHYPEVVCQGCSDYELPVHVEGLIPEEVLSATKRDKKMEQGHIRFILMDGIGKSFIDKTVTDEELLSCIQEITL